MKFHRVLLFTTIQMDITPVGEDLHVLLTCDNIPRIGCTAFARIEKDADTPQCEMSIISNDSDPDRLFCEYVAGNLAIKTGQNVLCTGGIFVDEPDEHMIAKLYENVDEMIKDWTDFLSD